MSSTAAGVGRGASPGELGGESSSSVTGLRARLDPAPAGASPPSVAGSAWGAVALMSSALGCAAASEDDPQPIAGVGWGRGEERGGVRRDERSATLLWLQMNPRASQQQTRPRASLPLIAIGRAQEMETQRSSGHDASGDHWDRRPNEAEAHPNRATP